MQYHKEGQKVSNKAQVPVPVTTNPTLVPGVPEPVPPSGTVKSTSFSEEIGFLIKLRRPLVTNKHTAIFEIVEFIHSRYH